MHFQYTDNDAEMGFMKYRRAASYSALVWKFRGQAGIPNTALPELLERASVMLS